jgi:hypothetical protein
MGVIMLPDLAFRMNKNSTSRLSHNKKRSLQNIKNPFLRLMKWIENARNSSTVCKE